MSVLLPGVLAVVMFGLGLGLEVLDFERVIREPKAVLVALAIQCLALPCLCFALLFAFQVPGELAVGMMILAASPGGTMANIFSHFSGGDVALNVTLTAVNCVTSVATLPIVVNLSLAHFIDDEQSMGIHYSEMVRVIATILVPVVIGMFVRRRSDRLATRLTQPLKRASAVILAIVILFALVGNLSVLREHFVTVGSAALALCCLSMLLGYWAPRAARVERSQAVASTFEIGIHNATLAVVVALSILDNDQMAVSPAIYGVVMYLPAFVAYLLLRRGGATSEPLKGAGTTVRPPLA
ncbi:bile acid:sodium symporter family protein [Streptomyces sp. NPDC056987]|uniref:bile acid:sodium symporter family protein n=1 Tax=Streptomyces sp. NPDC056987 TaxID=3345988 RepID=UPI0036294EFB